MNSIQAGFNHKQSTTARSTVSHHLNFAGKKETKDSLTLTSKKQAAAKAGHQGLSLKKLLIGGLLLGGAGTASAAAANRHGLSTRQENAGSPQFSDAVNALVPGLDNDGAVEVLKRPPFQPTNINLFSSVLYGGEAAKPAQGKPLNDKDAKALLERSLSKRFDKNSKDVKEALALFDNSTFKAIVPDARLRASIVNLKGTIGEEALEAYKNGTFESVQFANLTPDRIAHVITLANQTTPKVEVNGLYEFEDPRLLTSTLAHEALHQDLEISLPEERMAHSMDALAHGQTLLEAPDLLNNPTNLLQRKNTKLLARLNSRDNEGTLRLFESQGNVYPGAKTSLANFASAFTVANEDSGNAALKPSSPGNNVLKSMLNKVTGQSTESPDFSSASEALLDEGQQVFSPVEMVALAKALQLNVGELPKSENVKPTSTNNDPGTCMHTSGASRSHKILWF